MLDKELDKLRDKTLSFWCVIIKSDWTIYRSSGVWWTMPVSNKILGHPLVRGRIEHLDDNIENIDSYNICRYIWAILRESHLLDKSEIERMQHENRPELKELLIQFSNYL